ncbi:MAG: hypothetical protein ABSE89_06785 [Sedimentisphaerales bacterium]
MTSDKTGKDKVPALGKEPRNVFSVALALLKELLDSKGLHVKLDATGNVEFVIDGKKLDAIPKDKFKDGLTREHFLTLIPTEFESLVKVATYPDPTQGLQSEIPSKILTEVGKEEFLWRFQQVQKELIPSNLEERVMFRRTAQGFVLQDVNWQVMTKKQDNTMGKLSDIPCGYLSIIYASPMKEEQPVIRFRAGGSSMALPTIREPKQLMLELHQNDVEELIESLKNLRDNLERIKKTK